MKNWKPIFIENSRIPVYLSKLAPIEIYAITLGPIVISRGEMNEQTKRHETIHYQQYLETGFIGFLLIYLWDYIRGYARYKDGAIAYRSLRAETEAYENDQDETYLSNRVRWQWLKRSTVSNKEDSNVRKNT